MKPRLSQRLYAWLVRTYPADFRDEFGNHMQQDFRTRLARKPRGGLIMLWLNTAIDWLESMPREQWDVTRQDVRYACRTLAHSPLFTLVVVAWGDGPRAW